MNVLRYFLVSTALASLCMASEIRGSTHQPSLDDQKELFYKMMDINPRDVEWIVRTAVIAGVETEIPIPTPAQREPREIRYYEYRNASFIYLPITSIAGVTQDHISEIRNNTRNLHELVAAFGEPLQIEEFENDLSYALSGQFGVRSTDATEGCLISTDGSGTVPECLLSIIDESKQRDIKLIILLREDSEIPAHIQEFFDEQEVEHKINIVPEEKPMRFRLPGARDGGRNRSSNKKLATRDTRRGLFGEGWTMSRVSRAASVLTFCWRARLWWG